MEQLASGILNERLWELTQKPNPPFINAGVGRSGLVRSADAFSFDIIGGFANGEWGIVHVATDGAGHVTEVSSERALDGVKGDSFATHNFSREEMGLMAAALRAAPGLPPMRAVDRTPPIGVDALTAMIQAAADAA